MKTLQSIPLGNAAADAFLLLDDESVGRIVRALVYAARNELPAVPKPLRPVYFSVLAESCRIRGAKVPRPQDIRFAATPEDAQGGKADNAANAANAANGVEEIRLEENSPASAGDTRAPASVDGLEPSCPLTDEEVTHFAPAGMTPDEIRDWRDYYEARDWRIGPNAPRPMTRAAARASLRRWHTMQGVREAREAHLDAKADERALAVAAARDERRAPAAPDYAADEKEREKRDLAAAAAALKRMTW